METYIYSVNADNSIAMDIKRDHYGLLASFEIKAESEVKARGAGFSRWCKENPKHSHNLNDYTISCELK